MRYMGLDVGDKTIGIAVSDLTRLIAQPIRTLMRVSMGVWVTANPLSTTS